LIKFAKKRVNIGLYITELLENHDYVIVPGFGAFLTKYKPAHFDEERNLIHPPARDVFFNPDLKINDGVLLNHIAHREGLSAPKAHTALESLRQELNYRLDHGETVSIEGIGSISRKGMQFQFEPDLRVCTLPESFGLEPIENVIKHKKDSEIPSQHQEKKYNVVKAFKLWYLLIPIIAAVAIISWVYMRNKPGYSESVMFRPETMEDSNAFKEADNAAEIILPADSLHPETEKTTEKTDNTDTGQIHPMKATYYLIGGSFKSRENAEKYMEEARNKGHEPIYLGETGNFHLVALAAYSDENEAFSHQYRILKNDTNAGVWIFFSGEEN
jgi:nucleoid DNA-binding protein